MFLKQTTNFDNPNWPYQSAYTLGYNEAVENLYKFLISD